MIDRTNSILMKEPVIAGTVFLGVPLKTYFGRGWWRVTGIGISIIIGICVPGKEGY